jgi:pSer/pThr/pTyr-binding forkhead associated (FHA) protein
MISCQNCGYDHPSPTEFCEICGIELAATSTAVKSNAAVTSRMPLEQIDSLMTSQWSSPTPVVTPEVLEPPVIAAPVSFNNPAVTGTPKLISKQAGAVIPEFTLDKSSLLVGVFDPDSGPVEIDLDSFAGSDTVSRQHAEIYLEAGEWKVKDLTSTNGVFIKKSSQQRFSGKIVSPQVLEDGDEIAFAKIQFTFRTS